MESVILALVILVLGILVHWVLGHWVFGIVYIVQTPCSFCGQYNVHSEFIQALFWQLGTLRHQVEKTSCHNKSLPFFCSIEPNKIQWNRFKLSWWRRYCSTFQRNALILTYQNLDCTIIYLFINVYIGHCNFSLILLY